MLVSLNWINSIIDKKIDKNEYLNLAHYLTNIGLEVEEIINQSENLNNVVSAKIVKKIKHPNADKLSYMDLSTGDNTYKIVCGANNQKEGDNVVLAKVGAKLANGLEIKKTKIRGLESEGMCCSYEELGIEGSSDGIIILEKDINIGLPVAELLGLDDCIFNISIYPNRGDLLGQIGVAREIVNFNNSKIINIDVPKIISNDKMKKLEVNINDNDCYRYIARRFESIKVGPSPEWLIKRLESVGLRTINNIVDISNYVMFLCSQPLHIFDADKISNNSICVRKANANESLTLLDDSVIKLNKEDLLITSNEKILALAGVMGGKDSGVRDSTKNIILECAFFNSSSIRLSARRHNLSTDSSYRFERGIDQGKMDNVLNYTSHLIKELCEPEKIFDLVDVLSKKLENKEISFSSNELSSFLGTSIDENKIIEILKSLNFNILKAENGQISTKAPSYRNDIEIKEDVYEEILRIYGFDKIDETIPKMYISEKNNAFFDFKLEFKNVLRNLAYNETINYSFLPLSKYMQDPIEIINPISEDMKYLRTNLLNSLLRNMDHNFNHRNTNLKLFELGSTYKTKDEFIGKTVPKYNQSSYDEKTYLGLLLTGNIYDVKPWNKANRKVDFYDFKADIEFLFKAINLVNYEFRRVEESEIFHPGISAEIYVCNKYAGTCGALSPKIYSKEKVYYLELDYDLIVNFISKYKYKPYSKFPKIRRDLSFYIDNDLDYSELKNYISKLKLNYLDDFFIFDKYENIKEGKRISIAMGFIFSSKTNTLVDKEIDNLMDKLINCLKMKFSIEIR